MDLDVSSGAGVCIFPFFHSVLRCSREIQRFVFPPFAGSKKVFALVL